MKRTTFIIIALGVIVLLIGLWVYSLLYGSPQKASELFADFGFFGGNTSDTPIPIEPVIIEKPVVDVITAKLRQLTTRPIIGFYEKYSTTTEPRFIVYAEAGTGHIFSINLDSGEEIRISNITIPAALEATFSQAGDFVAIRSGYSAQSDVVLVDIRTPDAVTSETVPYRISDFTFDRNGSLLFTEETGAGTVGKKFSTVTKIVETIFTIPFLSATVRWSVRGDTPIYVYPKASARLPGYLYEVSAGKINRLPISGGGLTSEAGRNYIAFTKLVDTEQQSFIYNLVTEEIVKSPIIISPEKCIFSDISESTLYCGYEATTYSYSFPDEWYMGTRSFSDRIWRINLNSQSATQIINPITTTGRDLDITNMTTGENDAFLYFINKNDNTLWTYEF